jgi:hypothetical protein
MNVGRIIVVGDSDMERVSTCHTLYRYRGGSSSRAWRGGVASGGTGAATHADAAHRGADVRQ